MFPLVNCPLHFPLPGYNASLNPAVDAFFSTVAYRYGHATINDVVLRLDESWAMHPKGYLTLEQAYYNPNVALSAGLEPLIRGLLVQPQARVEPRWSLAVAGNFAGHSTVNGRSSSDAAWLHGWLSIVLQLYLTCYTR